MVECEMDKSRPLIVSLNCSWIQKKASKSLCNDFLTWRRKRKKTNRQAMNVIQSNQQNIQLNQQQNLLKEDTRRRKRKKDKDWLVHFDQKCSFAFHSTAKMNKLKEKRRRRRKNVFVFGRSWLKKMKNEEKRK